MHASVAVATQPKSPRRRREMPWIVLGVFLVVGCALVFALISIRAAGSQRVLAVSRSVGAGDVLTRADLETVRISNGSSLASVPASSESGVIGRPVAVPLAAGELLTPSALGTQRALPAGQAVLGLALKPGQFPLGLSQGDHVRVVDASGNSSGDSRAAPNSTFSGIVVATASGAADDGSIVLSLQVADADADAIAALGSNGHASVVVEPAGA